MKSLGIIFLLFASVFTLTLPRAYALIPLLLSATYTPTGEALNIAGATFTIPRLLIAVGFLRLLMRGESLQGRWTATDALVLVWGATLMGTSVFHTDDAWLFRLGVVWTELGTYFLARRLLRSEIDAHQLISALVFFLLPLAVLMAFEKATGTNPLSVFDSVPASAAIREGSVRASGPFSHPILAGTVGSILLGLGIALWAASKFRSVLSCAGGLVIVYSSASSGPLLMAAAIILSYLLLPCRRHIRALQMFGLLCLVGLNMVMNDPLYFLMAKIDLIGGSQGYFRAQLIRSAIEHWGEWWLAGTDYTRHWMPTGLKITSRHTDMTNHILWIGILGGIPLMAAFLGILAHSFSAIGNVVRAEADRPANEILLTWGLGCVLFGLTVNFMSITMFDHSVIAFWMLIALIANVTRERPPTRSHVNPRQPLAPTPVQFDRVKT